MCVVCFMERTRDIVVRSKFFFYRPWRIERSDAHSNGAKGRRVVRVYRTLSKGREKVSFRCVRENARLEKPSSIIRQSASFNRSIRRMTGKPACPTWKKTYTCTNINELIIRGRKKMTKKIHRRENVIESDLRI